MTERIAVLAGRRHEPAAGHGGPCSRIDERWRAAFEAELGGLCTVRGAEPIRRIERPFARAFHDALRPWIDSADLLRRPADRTRGSERA